MVDTLVKICIVWGLIDVDLHSQIQLKGSNLINPWFFHERKCGESLMPGLSTREKNDSHVVRA